MRGSRRVARLPALAVLVVVALVAGACSAQPVSQASTVPDTGPTAATASTPAESAAPSPDPGAPSSAATAPAPSDAAVAPPDKPANTTFAIVSEQNAGGGVRQTHRITWEAPEGQATSFVVYGVKACLRSAAKNNGTPCVAKGMRIPRNALVKLADAPGSDRSIDVAWVVPKSGKEPYAAVLIRATNAAGDSIFAIVHSEDVCVGC